MEDQIGVVLRDPSGVLYKEIRHSLDTSSGCYLASHPEPIVGAGMSGIIPTPEEWKRLGVTQVPVEIMPSTIYLVVQSVTYSTGHGESDSVLALSYTGKWDEHFAPAYTTREAAEQQREILGGGRVVELSLLERAAP